MPDDEKHVRAWTDFHDDTPNFLHFDRRAFFGARFDIVVFLLGSEWDGKAARAYGNKKLPIV